MSSIVEEKLKLCNNQLDYLLDNLILKSSCIFNSYIININCIMYCFTSFIKTLKICLLLVWLAEIISVNFCLCFCTLNKSTSTSCNVLMIGSIIADY